MKSITIIVDELFNRFGAISEETRTVNLRPDSQSSISSEIRCPKKRLSNQEYYILHGKPVEKTGGLL